MTRGDAHATAARGATRILVADDEAHIRDVVAYALEKEGYEVRAATDGSKAVAEVERYRPDLIVLDVSMPGMDGFEACRRIRAAHATPILFLSARGDEIDRVVGLEIGGDDYLVKPFSPRELVARVKAILRRAAVAAQGASAGDGRPDGKPPLVVGAVRIDLERHEVHSDGAPVKLTATELGVLASLFERPGVVLTRAQLMERAYAYDNLITERTIDTHVRRIRAKFRPSGVDPIETVHGVGYKARAPGT